MIIFKIKHYLIFHFFMFYMTIKPNIIFAQNRVIEYPRSSQSFTLKSAQEFGIKKLPKRIVNQYNLKEQTKLVLFRPKALPEPPKEFILDDDNPEKEYNSFLNTVRIKMMDIKVLDGA